MDFWVTLMFFFLSVLAGDQWWPLFVTVLFFITELIVLSYLIFWSNKLGVTVDIIPTFFF